MLDKISGSLIVKVEIVRSITGVVGFNVKLSIIVIDGPRHIEIVRKVKSLVRLFGDFKNGLIWEI
jgi:hypothetical protein